MSRSIACVSSAACLLVAVVCAARLVADDAKPATPAGTDQATMMAAMEKFATPGPEHAALAKWEGEWATEMEDLTPGAPGGKSSGTATAKMIMGGRYLQEEFKGMAMGMPFEGMAITGYDNQRKDYFSTWIDTMGTGIMISRGTKSGEKMDMTGEMTCPMMDKPGTTHSTITAMGDDKHVMEMMMTAPDGSPMGAIRVTYTRKK